MGGAMVLPISRRRRVRRVLPILGTIPLGILALFLSASVTLAQTSPCFNPNSGAAAAQLTHTATNGMQGNVDLVPATPFNPSTTGIIHPAQVIMASGDFIGWGTHIGVGTSGGITNCATYTGSLWILYVDGRTFGKYFCRASYGSEPATANDQHIEIRYISCSGSVRWAFYWNGNLKTCQAVDGTHGFAVVGGESLGHNPQKIDVRYQQLVYHVSNWANWTTSTLCENPGYDAVVHSVTDISLLEL